MNNTIVGVDLAKNLIQVCVVKDKKILSNNEMNPVQFAIFLNNTTHMTIIFEACATSNYWKQQANKAGHDAKLISPKLVSTIRQNQKTDKNDALAIVQASQLVNISFINGKEFIQQELQSIMRIRELAVKQKVALQNQISSLLLEFNIRISPAKGGVNGVVQATLEDAENGFSTPFRSALHQNWQQLLATLQSIQEYDKCLELAVEQHPKCKTLLALEGVGIINAINLYIALSSNEIGSFETGRDASACIGLTPVQHSSGGKTKLGAIAKYVKYSSMRSYLISGAMSAVNQTSKREPKTEKELWLKQLIERRGKRCASVALANKTVRTAFAIIRDGSSYQTKALSA